MRWKRRIPRAYTFIELLVGMLLSAFVFVGIFQYFRSSHRGFEDSQVKTQLSSSMNLVEQKLLQDIQSAIHLNSFCTGRPDRNPVDLVAVGDGFIELAACSDLRIQGGLIPVPGATKSEMEESVQFRIQPGLSENVLSTRASDGLRLITLDHELSSSGCRVYATNDLRNPVANVEALLVSTNDDPNCRRTTAGGIIEPGRFYILSQAFQRGSITHVASSLVEISAVSGEGDLVSFLTSEAAFVDPQSAQNNNNIPISIAAENPQGMVLLSLNSGQSAINLPGGPALMGFRSGFMPEARSSARLLPAKIIELAWEGRGGSLGQLQRREIYKLNGHQAQMASDWEVVSASVESLHVHGLTSSVQLGRAPLWSVGDPSADGLEDLMGLRLKVVLRSQKEFPRQEARPNPYLQTPTGQFHREIREAIAPASDLLR